MSKDSSKAPKQSKALTVVGWLLTVLAGLGLTASGVMKILKPEEVTTQFVENLGWPEKVLLPLAIVEFACVLLVLIPRTSVLGAIIATGYLGGATAAHVRVEDPINSVATPIVIGVVVWFGVFLRSKSVRAAVLKP